MTAEAALHAVQRRDPDGLADVLIELSEKERRALYPMLMDATAATPAPNRNEAALDRCFFISLWASGTSRDVRNTIASWRFAPDRRLADVVAARPRKTIDALVRTALRDDWNRGAWFVVRDLIRRGLVEHPEDEAYYEQMARALLVGINGAQGDIGQTVAELVVGRLQEDDQLPQELLRALDFEAAVNCITGPYLVDGWLLAFRRAVELGVFDREVMLDVSLDGQLRDLRKSSSSFFRKLFQGLEPTPDELARRADTFIRIVSASAPSEQAAAAKVLRGLARSRTDLDAAAVASAVVTPLTASHKGAAIAALRLLSDLAVEPTERAAAAVHGLGHPHADVQEAALRLLEECGNTAPSGVRADALVWVDAVAPSLRDRLVRWVGIDDPGPAIESPPGELDARLAAFSGVVPPGTNLRELLEVARAGNMPGPVHFDPWTLPDTGAPVEPILDLDDLVSTLTVVLAGTGTPVDLERVIDGLSRFDRSAVPDAALSPVRAAFRSEYHGAAWHGWEVRGHVEVAARCWCERRTPPPLPYLSANKRRFRRAPALSHDLTQPPKDAEGHWWSAAFDGSSYTAGILGFLAARLWEAVTAATTQPLPTLALPSTTAGWVDDDELLERLDAHRRLGAAPGRFDAIQALLRLRPGRDRASGFAASDGMVVPTAIEQFRGASVRLDDAGLVRAVGETAQPSSIRLATFPKEKHRQEVTVLRYELDAPAPTLRRDDPVGQLVAELHPPDERPRVNIRWTPSASALFAVDRLLVDWTVIGLPRHRDVVAARAAALLAEDLDANRSSDCLHSLLAAASDPDLALTFAMHVLLAMGLADRNVITCTAAGDLLHDAANDGRLDTSMLGRILAELSNGGIIKPARVAKTMATIVPLSPLIAERVREVLCVWLGEVEGVPRDLHAVLETLELACAGSGNGVDSARARTKLTEAGSGSSKRAKAAKRLLELPRAESTRAAALAAQALMDRAERWAGSAS